MEDWKHSNSRR